MKAAIALLLFVCLSTVSATLPLSWAGAPLTPAIAWLALAAGAIGAVIYWLTSPGSSPLRMRWPDWIAVAVFALFGLRSFCWLSFRDGDGIFVLSPNNLGDYPLHLTYIRSIAKGLPFWPHNPIYSGYPLHYPAGIDIFNAFLNLVGCDDFRAMAWVGLAGSALTCYALLRWGGWFATLGFLCNSGFAGWRFFHHFKFELRDYQQAYAWKSLPLSMFITQRGLLYALPAGLLLLSAWRAQWFAGEDGAEPPARPSVRIPVWVQVVLYASMPLFHIHTFLFLSAVLGFWFLLGKKSVRLRHQVADLLLWAILPATICVSLVTGLFQRGTSAASVVHLKPGWMQDDQPFFQFWTDNFGILPILVAALVISLAIRYRRSSSARNAAAFVFPAASLFLLCCFVMFAPWEWDNMKLMIWCYLAVLPFLHEALLSLPGAPGILFRPVCYTLLLFSGFVSLAGGLRASDDAQKIADVSELDSVELATRALPATATFAGYPTYNHPLLMSGCTMVEGYDGHLHSHGIPYQARLVRLQELMNGSPDWREIADALDVHYLFWGSREEGAYPDSTQPWKGLPVVASGDWGTIYDLSEH